MPLDWNSALSDLNVRLARLYPDPEKRNGPTLINSCVLL
jgi:hypothetical protein